MKKYLRAYVESEGPAQPAHPHSLIRATVLLQNRYYRMYEWRAKVWYFAHAQDDVNLHILRMLEGTFLLDAAYIISQFLVTVGVSKYPGHVPLSICFLLIVPSWFLCSGRLCSTFVGFCKCANILSLFRPHLFFFWILEKLYFMIVAFPGPEIIKHFSCSTQLNSAANKSQITNNCNFFLLNVAAHKICSSNKYEIAKCCWKCQLLLAWNFLC